MCTNETSVQINTFSKKTEYEEGGYFLVVALSSVVVVSNGRSELHDGGQTLAVLLEHEFLEITLQEFLLLASLRLGEEELNDRGDDLVGDRAVWVPA